MGNAVPWLVGWAEKKFAHRPSPRNIASRTELEGHFPLSDGETVAIVGGGIAGCIFARQLLRLAGEKGIGARLILFNTKTCNYCGGLITDLSTQTLKSLFDLDIPAEVALGYIKECVYINPYGDVPVEIRSPLISTLRTSKFGQQGFDDSLKERIMNGVSNNFTGEFRVVEPARVLQVTPPNRLTGQMGTVRYKTQQGEFTLEANVLVIATGLSSLGTTMMEEFRRLTRYQPPAVMEAGVTEVDASFARFNNLQERVLIVDGVVPHCVVALIPKKGDWLTVTSLEKKLSLSDLERVFACPGVRKYIDLPSVREALRCRSICGAGVFTRGARNFYGDGWVTLGDLTGYGRVLKDGYFAAFTGAHLAASTMINQGTTRKAFRLFYHRPLLHVRNANVIGMLLFRANSQLATRRWFGRLLLLTAREERTKNRYGGYVHAAIRALTTGDLSYLWIALFFTLGLLRGSSFMAAWHVSRRLAPNPLTKRGQ
ncbi:hypothetical protein SY88_20025 [Clostridiales bacterium PH28_bin88]|nr:hypothetical protein SY88_20025 [Clostridiales bacterium PH28_bin88]